jgi:hypothetical protein
MAYKQSPGRQAMPKTGRGISPTLMSESPMKQQIEYTQKHSRKVKEQAEKTSTPEGRSSFTSGKQTAMDPVTGTSSPKPATHSIKIEGMNAVQYDSSNKPVKTVRYHKESGGGSKYENLVKEVEKANKTKASQASRNANFDNLTGGLKAPVTAAERKTMRDLDRTRRGS